ncbi:hypothetical protein V2J09_010833 [Rumex salicifolius]
MSPKSCGISGGNGSHKRSFDEMNEQPHSRCQKRLFEAAMSRNIIAVIEAWTSKATIAAKLIKEFAKAVATNSNNDSRPSLIVFLAPTVTLLYLMIKARTDLHVRMIDESLFDQWNAACWLDEINNCNILIMTPQIILDTLRKAYLSIEAISLLIFDECHNATGDDSSLEIMKDFYHKSVNKPKIFGMTTFPLIRKDDEDHRMIELESLLDSQVYGVVDKRELEEFTPPSREIYRFYDLTTCLDHGLRNRLHSLFTKYDFTLMQESSTLHREDIKDKLKTLQRRLSDDHLEILYCLDNLGLLCAYEAVIVCIAAVPIVAEDSELIMETASPCKSFLNEALIAMKEYYPQGNETAPQIEYGLEAVNMGTISPKFSKLLQIVESFCKDIQVKCLIFVEKTIVATKALRLSHVQVLCINRSSLSADALTSEMQNQPESVEKGKVNLLFATDVSQDGLIMPSCSHVICFDLPKTVQDYVNCWQQAHQNDCQLIMMLERNNQKQRDHLFEIIRSKRSIYDTPKNEYLESCIPRASNVQQGNLYIVESTGASVNANSSVNLIQQYCLKLSADRYCSPKPIFKLLQSGSSYAYKLILPPNAAFQTIVGPQHRHSHISKQLVCLEACKKLHQMGALDDGLLPCIDVHTKQNLVVQTNGSVAGAGTTKRKELHGITHIRSLAGSWSWKACAATYHAYKIVFPCDIDDEICSSFILFTESRLDDDVTSTKIDLHVQSNKVIPSSISPCGQMCFDVDQIARAMHFHELFYNALFGKIFQGSRTSGDRRFLLENNSEQLWSPSYMYLLLPLETLNVHDPDSWSINWKAIDSCVSATEFMRSYWLSPTHSESDRRKFAASGDRNCSETDIIHLANTSSHVDDLKSTVAFSVHTGKMYTIIDVVNNSSAESPFDGNSGEAKPKFSTFADYYYKKYGILLLQPKQPLLLLKQSHNPFNLLVDFNTYNAKATTPNPFSRVHMPPELLVIIDVPVSVLKSSYLLPSVMHRLESLMLASQLRKEIGFNSTEAQISSVLILEALTTLRCCENFSMERLELLGDSVLKYAVSCHLFHEHPNKHEGELSSKRSGVICNATLHKLGISRQIQEYIRDSAFEPRRWVAPGQLSIHPVPCSHGLDTREVLSDNSRFTTFEENVMVGKSCDKGHRWLVSKAISDCVEALIGAYYVGGGLLASMHVFKWLGIDVDIEPTSLDKAINGASLRSYTLKSHEIEALERKLKYEFSVKGLLLEAVTHSLEQESELGYCYERLEFLGDSVLDLLITTHLYQTYADIDPGELTDLRSASVNNESFAQTSSGFLLNQIEEYRKVILDDENLDKSTLSQKGPKVLGDLIESIAGAVVIDTRLNLDVVWKIFKPLLDPIATPETIELPPIRELIELCDSLGYYFKEHRFNESERTRVELRLQLKDELVVGKGSDRTRKNARGQAAAHLLKILQKRGISHAQCVSKRNKKDSSNDGDQTRTGLNVLGSNLIVVKDSAEVKACKKPKISQLPMPNRTVQNNTSIGTPAIAEIDMQKGGPRKTLFELCKRLQWPRPTFESTEKKSRSPIELGEGSEKRKCFNTFESKISLCIPELGDVEATGDQKADKKSSLDDAALALLYELQKRGLLNIGHTIPSMTVASRVLVK